MPASLKNIPLRTFREFLVYKGLKHIRTSAGHEVWTSSNLLRPVVIQTHIDPVPEFIVKRNLSTIGSNRDEFIEFLKNG
jgi:hypothetical protein